MLLLKFLKEIKKNDDDQRLEGVLSKYSAYHVIMRTWFIPSTHAKAGYSGNFL